jgi:hypothetical protein
MANIDTNFAEAIKVNRKKGRNLTSIFAVKEAFLATFLLGVLDFENIRIDDVSDVVGIESGFVVIDDFLVEVANLAQILHRQDGHVEIV